jgi:hypothetical protein
VETYSQFLSGEVYGYTIDGPSGEYDSCWGFYDLDNCREEADGALTTLVEDAQQAWVAKTSTPAWFEAVS